MLDHLSIQFISYYLNRNRLNCVPKNKEICPIKYILFKRMFSLRRGNCFNKIISEKLGICKYTTFIISMFQIHV